MIFYPKASALICWIATLMLPAVAHCAPREVLFFVEEPLILERAPPLKEQMDKIDWVQSELSRRFSQISIDGHRITDGKAAPADKVYSSDFVVQVAITVGRPGYLVQAKLFQASTKTWSEIARRLFGEQPQDKLEAAISNEVIPPILIRILESAQPSDRSVMMADCLSPATSSDSEAIQAGRIFSQGYANQLQANDVLKKAFSVVRMVSTNLPKFYTWWCVELSSLPRQGIQRDDTLVISGQIEAIRATPTSAPRFILMLEGKKSARVKQALDIVPLDLADPAMTARKINQAVEELTNGL
jgi:hypothetical protein